jgi:hypothetical protein
LAASASIVWLLVVLAFVLANLPFVSASFLGIWQPRQPKTLWAHLAELLLLYGVTGAVAWLIEHQMGQASPQKWEFFAITGAMFLTLAFPGFVYRYLWRRHG